MCFFKRIFQLFFIIDFHSDKVVRPSKKRGGGGYGFFNEMNQTKKFKKSKIYKPVQQKQDKRQFSN